MRNRLVFSIIVSIVSCVPVLAYDWSTNPGDGSEANPYQISTPEQLNAIGTNSALLNKCFRLTADIDMSAYSGTRYNIIGRGSGYYTGVFDGDGYTVFNLAINQPNMDRVGLFGVIQKAEIKNIGLENIDVIGHSRVGGLVGDNRRGTLRGCSTAGTVSGTSTEWVYCGGLAGNSDVLQQGVIIDCHSSCDIITNGKGVGCLIGIHWGGRIANCYATGSVTGYGYVGGLVGSIQTISVYPSKGVIENSFSTGNVSGHDRVGGFAGECGSAIIRNCYATGSVTGVDQGIGGLVGTNYFYPYGGYGEGIIDRCYSTGKVTGYCQTGGLVGRHWNQSVRVYRSFWDTQTSGKTCSSGGVGKNTVQMQIQNTFTNWDFDAIWFMADYPVFQWEISPLQPLIDAAVDGDVIAVEPGIYEGRLYFKGKNITLTSVDPADPDVVANTIIRSAGVGAVITFDGTEDETCVLSGFTITGGYATTHGGGIRGNDSLASVRHCVFRDSTVVGALGGGIWGIAGTISNCIFENNYGKAGGGLAQCNGVISNCLIINNTSAAYGSALHNCDGFIQNCTLVDDSQFELSLIHISDGLLENCIMQTVTGTIFSNSTAVTRYCCHPEATGEGDIDVDPIFVDPNGVDFRLLPDSLCINAGTPDYVAGLDETDLDGHDRIVGPAVDMGCYEFPNTAPVADAGLDQVVYAWVDRTALVPLDGTGSIDADGDALAYYWYDANELIAEGAEPNVVLSVGEHVIDLIVNDGIEDSEPNSCVVTVIEAMEIDAKMTPQSLNRNGKRPHVIGRLEFAGESMPVLDPNEPMVLLAGQVQIEDQRQMLTYSKKDSAWYLAGFFDNVALIEAITEDGVVEVTLAAKLLSGQWVYGRDVVTVK